jgi:hypothetical protein
MSETGLKVIWRAAWIFAALAGSAAGFFLWQPMVDAAMTRLEDARARLQSDRVAFATKAGLERERDRLRRRYASAAAGRGEADLLRRLSLVAQKHHVRVLSADVAPPSSRPEGSQTHEPAALESTAARIEMSGSYRALLLAIDDLARGSDLVRIEQPSLRAAASAIDASIPVVILRPSSVR